MNRIRLLSEQVANQIAAGEVVERPASVVKELIENALDAQAGRITVEIAAGGRSLIRVTDDGWGMSKDDALLCLERHATSKIRRAEDLAAIDTMGFRGEAVPSIASVSRFALTSRERDDVTGEATQIIINGGKIIEVKSAAGPPGTTVEVRQLFFNLPARRKFLRTEETERAHIQHYVTLAALAHPRVGFTFLSDGRLVWQLPPLKFASDAERMIALRERMRPLHGGGTPLLAVDFKAELEEAAGDGGDRISNPEPMTSETEAGTRGTRFSLWGLIGSPGVSRGTRDEQHLFVNRRPVENRGLNFALLEGYHTALMKGRYPVCCLFLEIDPAAVDVNIHPAKREVKFREEPLVRRLVTRAVRDTLLSFHRQSGSTPTVGGGSESSQDQRQATDVPAGPVRPDFNLEIASPPPARIGQPSLPMGFSVVLPQAEPAAIPSEQISSPPPAFPTVPPTVPAVETAASVEPVPEPMSARGSMVALLQVPLRLVGVIGRLYVVLESDRGLVLMDQHAAHERILFEQMLRRLEASERAASQGLLLPETVELSARDAEFVRQNLDTLSRLGVGLREFGERTFLLDALPPFVKDSNPKRFAVSLIDELKAVGAASINALRLGEDVVAKTVCRHAVKANDPLSGPELENLVTDLRHCAMPYTCPHGRPTLIEMNWRDLEKRFGRTG